MFSNDIQEYYSCSRTVCGDVWLKVFIKSLNPVDATTIIEMKSRVFQTALRGGGWNGGGGGTRNFAGGRIFFFYWGGGFAQGIFFNLLRLL